MLMNGFLKNLDNLIDGIVSSIRNTGTSKKLAWFSGICFIVALIYSMVTFTYSVHANVSCDLSFLITLISVTGATFGATMCFYYNKARYENVIKEQCKVLRMKYLILKDVGLLDELRIQEELDGEFLKMDNHRESEEQAVNQEITVQE